MYFYIVNFFVKNIILVYFIMTSKTLYYTGDDFKGKVSGVWSDYVADVNTDVKTGNWLVPLYAKKDSSNAVGYISWQSVALQEGGNMVVTEFITVKFRGRSKMGHMTFRDADGYYNADTNYAFDLIGHATSPNKKGKIRPALPYTKCTIVKSANSAYRKVTLS